MERPGCYTQWHQLKALAETGFLHAPSTFMQTSSHRAVSQEVPVLWLGTSGYLLLSLVHISQYDTLSGSKQRLAVLEESALP